MVRPSAGLDPVIPPGGSELEPRAFQRQFTRLNNDRNTDRRVGLGEHVNPNALGAQIESGWLAALQSSASGNSNATLTTEKTGGLLNLVA